MDVEIAYQNVDLDKKIYMSQPEDCVVQAKRYANWLSHYMA